MPTDTFQYTVQDNHSQATATVTVNIQGGGTQFVSASDDSFTTLQGTADVVDVLTNDTFSSGLGPLIIAPGSVTTPSPSGTAVISADQKSILYTPASGFLGQATFSYTARSSVNALMQDTALVTGQVVSSAQSYVQPPDLLFPGATTVTVNSTATLDAALAGQANNTTLVIICKNAVYGSITQDWGSAPTGRKVKIIAENKVFTKYDPMSGVKTNYQPKQAQVNGMWVFEAYDQCQVEGFDFFCSHDSIHFAWCRAAWLKHCQFLGLNVQTSGNFALIGACTLGVIQECFMLAPWHTQTDPRYPDNIGNMDYGIRSNQMIDLYILGTRVEGIYSQPISFKGDPKGRMHARMDYSMLLGDSPLAQEADKVSGVMCGQEEDYTSTGDNTVPRVTFIRSRFKCGPEQDSLRIINVHTVIIDQCIFEECRYIMNIFQQVSTKAPPLHPTLTHMKNCTLTKVNGIFLSTRGMGGIEVLRLENNTVPSLCTITRYGALSGLARVEHIGNSGFKP